MAFDPKYACISALPPPDFDLQEEAEYIAELEEKWGVKFVEFEARVQKLVRREVIDDLAISDKNLVEQVKEACKRTQLFSKSVREKMILNKKLEGDSRRRNGYLLFRLVRICLNHQIDLEKQMREEENRKKEKKFLDNLVIVREKMQSVRAARMSPQAIARKEVYAGKQRWREFG